MHTNLHMVDGIGRLCQASEEPSRIWMRSRSNEGVRFNAFANRSIVSSCSSSSPVLQLLMLSVMYSAPSRNVDANRGEGEVANRGHLSREEVWCVSEKIE